MDIEQLTKSQIILLTLLVSFVTSIATGIVTVTLLDQAPATVSGTINKVVERTIERVVPAEPSDDNQQAAAVTSKETTIVVKESDLVTESIAFNQERLVRIYTASTPQAETAASTTEPSAGRVFRGYGFIARSSGVVATTDEIVIPGRVYEMELSDGTLLNAEILIEGVADIGLFTLLQTTEEDTPERTFSQVTYTDPNALKLGQTVIQISGIDSPRIALGSIAGLERELVAVPSEEGSEDAPQKREVLTEIQTTIAGQTPLGAPLANMFKEIVAVGTSAGYVPVTNAAIAALIEEARTLEGKPEEIAQGVQ